MQLTTRSGTNEYHGGGPLLPPSRLVERQQLFNNANSVQEHHRYNFYGYDFSGPVPFLGERDRRKLFFFFSQEYYSQVIPEAAAQHPRAHRAERNGGDFSQTTDGNGAEFSSGTR